MKPNVASPYSVVPSTVAGFLAACCLVVAGSAGAQPAVIATTTSDLPGDP